MPYLSDIEQWAMAKGEAKGRKLGLEQGREQGIEQGREQGIEQGREQGIEQGIEQGRVEMLQANIVRIMELRYGAAGKRLAGKVRRLQQLDQLRAVFDAIVTANNVAEVRQLLTR